MNFNLNLYGIHNSVGHQTTPTVTVTPTAPAAPPTPTYLLVLESPPDLWRRFTLDVDLEVDLLGGTNNDLLQFVAVDVRLDW